MSPRTRLQDFTNECVVHVLPEDIAGNRIEGGSGFFVAPGVIVTCAHVVSRAGRAVSRVKVEWKEKTYEGTAVARPQVKGDGEIWDPPDLCVITLDRAPTGQPSVVLGELRDADHDELYIAGYNRIYSRSSVKFQSKFGLAGGSQGLAGEMVREIAGAEIAHGMSGGPVLDMLRGTVCGVVKTQRKPNDNLGGLFIPAEFIQREFKDEAWLPNERASALNSPWREQRDAVLDQVDPAMFRLNATERDLLVRVASELRLAAEDFTRSWGDITELPPSRAFASLNDLIADLADRTSNGLDPITKLFVWLACRDRIPVGSENELLDYARLRVIRQGEDHRLLLVRYQESVLVGKLAPRSPVLVVRLRPASPGATRIFRLDIWRYADRGSAQHPVMADGGPYRLTDARTVIIGTVKEQVKLLGGRPVIEFALPDSLLDHPVEEWDIGNEVPLGEKYPVVVRLAEREADGISYDDTLKSRATDFRNGSVPPRGTRQWDDLWLGCQSQYTPRELNRVLRQGKVPMIAMTAWHGRGRALKAIKAVKEAGVAVIVWRHMRCTGTACAVNDGDRPCPGTRFKQQAADHVAGERLAGLPEKIFAARPTQPSNGGLGYESPGIALIWDDPGLLPWVTGKPNRYPDQPGGWEDVEQLVDL